MLTIIPPTQNGHTNGVAIAPVQTGPKTEAGKAQSRLNALKHGLSACDEVFLTGLAPEYRSAYVNLRCMLRRHYQPRLEYERLLVDRIAVAHFRALCLNRLEASALARTPAAIGSEYSIVPHLDRFSRYDIRIERQIRTLHNRLVHSFKRRGVTYHKPYTINQ